MWTDFHFNSLLIASVAEPLIFGDIWEKKILWNFSQFLKTSSWAKSTNIFPTYIIFSNKQGRPQRGDLVWRGNEPSQWMLDRKIYVSCFSLDSNFPFIQPALIPPYNRTEAIILVLLKNLNLCQTQLMKMPISVFFPPPEQFLATIPPDQVGFPP